MFWQFVFEMFSKTSKYSLCVLKMNGQVACKTICSGCVLSKYTITHFKFAGNHENIM